MLRALDIGLIALPFAIVMVCWVFGRIPTSRFSLGLAFAGLFVYAGLVAWAGLGRSMGRRGFYVPAQMVDGHIVPGHEQPRAAGSPDVLR